MIDKEYLYEIQKDAYEILNCLYETEGNVSPDILQDYSFQLSFEELLAELDEIFEEDEETILKETEQRFGKDFINQYTKYINDTYYRLHNVTPC